MNLKEYINWANSLDAYEDGARLSNNKAWGYKTLDKVKVPKFRTNEAKEGDEGYWHYRDVMLDYWAKKTWPDLKFLNTKIQIQKPGQICKPHLDFLGYYLEDVCMAHPGLLKLEHSLDNPAVDVWRMFVAIEDQESGQRFVINNNDWTWKAGDCIRLNNWQALHWTENTSKKNRTIIKITGVNF